MAAMLAHYHLERGLLLISSIQWNAATDHYDFLLDAFLFKFGQQYGFRMTVEVHDFEYGEGMTPSATQRIHAAVDPQVARYVSSPSQHAPPTIPVAPVTQAATEWYEDERGALFVHQLTAEIKEHLPMVQVQIFCGASDGLLRVETRTLSFVILALFPHGFCMTEPSEVMLERMPDSLFVTHFIPLLDHESAQGLGRRIAQGLVDDVDTVPQPLRSTASKYHCTSATTTAPRFLR